MPPPMPGYVRLGFTSNPFIHNLADNETGLADYYLKPPYFAHILGEAANQTSRIVLGEFGGGKTALRKRIEYEARSGSFPVLCITYDTFPYLSRGEDPAAATLDVHISELMKRATVALLMQINEHGSARLNKVQREIARWLVHYYYESLTTAEIESYCKSVSTVPDRLWRGFKEHSGTIFNWLNNGLTVLLGLPISLQVPELKEKYNEFEGNSILLLQKAFDLFQTFGVQSVVVLVDSVDQPDPDMRDLDRIIAFLRPILFNYNLMCLTDSARKQIYGFKFFLPFGQRTKSKLDRMGFDFLRVLDNSIEWRPEDMSEIWTRRLAYYSNRRILGLGAKCEDTDIDTKICSMAAGIPRRMIVMGERILEEYDQVLEDCHRNNIPVPSSIPAKCTERAIERCQSGFTAPS